jgi:hypothetical protein
VGTAAAGRLPREADPAPAPGIAVGTVGVDAGPGCGPLVTAPGGAVEPGTAFMPAALGPGGPCGGAGGTTRRAVKAGALGRPSGPIGRRLTSTPGDERTTAGGSGVAG